MTTDTGSTKALLPCPMPWCEAKERGGDYSPAVRLHHFGNYRVVCTSCICEGPLRSTKDEAIEAWNNRPVATPAPAEQGEVERLARRIVADRSLLDDEQLYERIKAISRPSSEALPAGAPDLTDEEWERSKAAAPKPDGPLTPISEDGFALPAEQSVANAVTTLVKSVIADGDQEIGVTSNGQRVEIIARIADRKRAASPQAPASDKSGGE